MNFFKIYGKMVLNEKESAREKVDMSGILLLDKGEGITSQGAVTRVKRLFGESKVGHTGTLDPMATGLLPILLGRAVKASEFLLSSHKHYEATLRLGLTTDTEDITGTVLTAADALPSEDTVLKALEGFRGQIWQTPPMYSALKVGGKKLVDLARAGVVIDRAPREITVYRLEAEKLSESDYRLDVICSKGTYIRTLCADIGAALGVGGVMAALRRVEAGGFSLSDAYTLEQLEAMNPEERQETLLPVERIFESCEKITLPPFFARLLRCGAAVSQKKLGLGLPIGTRLRLYDKAGFFAVAEIVICEDEPAVKPIRQFDI